jgi:hypothetical protein
VGTPAGARWQATQARAEPAKRHLVISLAEARQKEPIFKFASPEKTRMFSKRRQGPVRQRKSLFLLGHASSVGDANYINDYISS